MRGVRVLLVFLVTCFMAMHANAKNAPSQSKKQFDHCLKGAFDDGSLIRCYAIYTERLKADLRRENRRIALALSKPGPALTDYAAATKNLKAAHAAWLRYVEQDCDLLHNTFGEGNAFALVGTECTNTHYENRLKSLKFSSGFLP